MPVASLRDFGRRLEHVVAGRALNRDRRRSGRMGLCVVGVLVLRLAVSLERLDAGVVGLNQNLVGWSDQRTSSSASAYPRAADRGRSHPKTT